MSGGIFAAKAKSEAKYNAQVTLSAASPAVKADEEIFSALDTAT